MLAPNTENYSLGKGVVYFDRLDANGAATGELDLGNAPEFTIAAEVETLDHFSSREGLKKKDLSVDVSMGFKAKFKLDEYSLDNLNLALYGDGAHAVSQPAGSISDSIVAKVGRWVKLTKQAIASASVTVTHGGTTFTVGTDYTIDTVTGRIYIVATGTITADEAITVHYDYAATTYQAIYPGERSPVEGFLRFVGNNTIGPKHHAECWKVKLKLAGDISMITDSWGALDFEAEILDDTTSHPANPFFQITDITSNAAPVS